MTEPVYTFIPGKGWVPLTENKVLAYQKDGRAIWIIDRMPVNGERYVLNYGKDRLDTFEKVTKHVAAFTYENQKRWPGDPDDPFVLEGDESAWTLEFADE